MTVAYTQRVEVGAYYTDGERLVEITRVYELGHIGYRDVLTGVYGGAGIAAFRRTFWLARGPENDEWPRIP